MFGIFKKKKLVSEETVAWLFECYSWALENFGTDVFYEDTKLVKPTDEFFPDIANGGHDLAESLLKRVKEYAGMGNWPTRLVQQERDADPVVAPTVVMQNAPRGPAGTFSISKSESEAVITYKEGHLREPEKLVATLAHELAHYLSLVAEEPPPGGDDNWEYATDLTAVFMGFGLFQANSSFTFSQFSNHDSQGWSYETLGYLSRYEFVYALAIFCVLKEIEDKEVLPFLSSGLRGYYRKAKREIMSNLPRIEALRKIEKPIKQGSAVMIREKSLKFSPNQG